MWCDLHELFGNHEYQIGLKLEDACSNQTPLAADTITTPAQEFAQVEGFCFVATAAYGAPWADRVKMLRIFRDDVLRTAAFGALLVEYYYYVSPPLASFIGKFDLARGMAQVTLGPLTEAARLILFAKNRWAP